MIFVLMGMAALWLGPHTARAARRQGSMFWQVWGHLTWLFGVGVIIWQAVRVFA